MICVVKGSLLAALGLQSFIRPKELDPWMKVVRRWILAKYEKKTF